MTADVLHAEQSVLGAMMLTRRAVGDAIGIVNPESWLRGAHRSIFEAIEKLYRRGDQIDAVTVADELDRLGWLESAGGPEYLTELIGVPPTTANVEHYARIVRDRAARRHLLDAGERLIRAAKDPGVTLDDAATATMEALVEATAAGTTVVGVDDILDDIIDRWCGDLPTGESTGWSQLDRLYTVAPGYVTVITGVPSAGKSTWLDHLTINLAEKGWRWLIFSAENAPAAHHAQKIAAVKAARDFDIDHVDEEARDDVLEWVRERYRWIDVDLQASVYGILNEARMVKLRYGLDAVVLDPWNEMEHRRPRGVREDEYLSSVLSAIRRFARKERVHVFIVAHPNSDAVKTDSDGLYQVVGKYGILGGSTWPAKADAMLSVWRDNDGVQHPKENVRLHVLKIREEGTWGETGMTTLRFDRRTHRFRYPGGGDAVPPPADSDVPDNVKQLPL